MWDPPRAGIEPTSPALAGRLLSSVPPGKSNAINFMFKIIQCNLKKNGRRGQGCGGNIGKNLQHKEKKRLQMIVRRFYHVLYRFNQVMLSATTGARLSPPKGRYTVLFWNSPPSHCLWGLWEKLGLRQSYVCRQRTLPHQKLPSYKIHLVLTF